MYALCEERERWGIEGTKCSVASSEAGESERNNWFVPALHSRDDLDSKESPDRVKRSMGEDLASMLLMWGRDCISRLVNGAHDLSGPQ